MEKIVSIKSPSYLFALDNFDYDAIHNYMLKVNWEWAVPYQVKGSVPSIDKIKQTAFELMVDIVYSYPNENEYWVESGGLRAWRKNGEYWIEFHCKK